MSQNLRAEDNSVIWMQKRKRRNTCLLDFFSGKLIFGKEKNQSTNNWIGSTRENKRGNKISSFIKLLFSKEWKNT